MIYSVSILSDFNRHLTLAEQCMIYNEKEKELKFDCIMIEARVDVVRCSAFGNAYLAQHIKSGQQYVIKKVELGGKSEEQRQNIFNEVKFLQQFKHPNIVSYKESIIQGQELNIIMEFCYGGDLNQLIQEQKQNQGGKKLEEKQIVDWATQVALAIFYMHEKRILHRDLKTPNIFIVDQTVKLGDFGISKVLDQKVDLASTSIGTPYYMSPEQYRHKPYSYRSDIWAFGCILYEMCNQKRPFQAYSLNGLAVKVLQAHHAPVSEFYSKQLRDLINRMLQKKQKDRPTILHFLQTPIIKRRAANYLKQLYQKLIKNQGEKDIIQGVQYQAKKLGISLDVKKEYEKKIKPQFSAERKKQQKQRIRLQLQEELRKISQKDKQQKQELKRLTEDRKNLVKKNKKQDKISLYGRKQSSSKSSLKDNYTNATESRSVESIRSKEKEEKPKPFEIKEKYDMYQMEYEEESEDEEVEVIHQVEEEQEYKHEKQFKTEKEPQIYSKEKYVKSKEGKSQASRFTQLAPVQLNKAESQVPIEEVITNLKQSLKINNQILNTIKNQISNIDFSLSSSQDQFEKTLSADQMPEMKKKEKNPAHVVIADKANDLKQSLQSVLSRVEVDKILTLAKLKGSFASRQQIEKVVGNKQGAYHLAAELVKLTNMLAKIPLYS